MKILFCCGDYLPNPGGAQSLINDLAMALGGCGHEVTVLTRRHPDSLESERFAGYDVLRLDYPVLYEKFDLSRAFVERSHHVVLRLTALLTERRFDVVCIGLLDMSALYLLALRPVFGFRTVLYLHGGETRKLPTAEPTYAELFRLSLEMADAIIAVSGDLAREASDFAPNAASKIRAIHNGIDVRAVGAAAPRLHAGEYVCYAGRLTAEKDLETLVAAFARAQPYIGEVDLLIAGGGKLEQNLRELARGCPRPGAIQFLGQVDRACVHALLKGALFAVLPSITEGFPIVAIEALSAGTPVIGSRIPGISAAVEDGVNAALFPAGDAAALSELIRRYCSHREALASLAAGARATDLRRFDIESVAEQHLRVFEGRA